MLVRAVGRTAALLEVEDPATVPAWRATVLRLVDQGRLPPPVELVPGARTLLLDGTDPGQLRSSLAAAGPLAPEQVGDSRLVEVPVTYDGEDLAEVARLWGTSEQGVVDRHTGTEWSVAFCGFAPGFPYLVAAGLPEVGLPEVGLPEVPRRASPRPVVPAGSVALAGRYCGIYPTASPGGWQLLGRTGLRLFDPGQDPPAALPPGTRVRFVAAQGQAAAAPMHAGQPDPGARHATLVRAGALTTVQDGGRLGAAHLGVPRGGPLDGPAARLANRLVGNPEDAALLETTLTGVALQPAVRVTVAVTGAVAPVTVDHRPASWGVAVSVPAGAVLDVGTATSGLRCYVAVAGGIAVAPVLGSRCRDTLAGLGPAPGADGDVLPLGDPGGPPPPVEFTVPADPGPEVLLRLGPGPRADWFGPAGLAQICGTAYRLSPLSDRIGARLTGPPVPRVVTGELESEGIVLGAVQVPPDGQPVVLLADHPTTGGYPVIGVVETADLAALAQARPGTPVRFTTDRRAADG